MPNSAPVIILVGHGSVSSKKLVIDVGNYNIILPVKVGDKLCLTAHNMIVFNLTSTNTPDELFFELKKFENLPSTTSVAKTNTKSLNQNFNINLGEHLVRKQLEKLLKEAEIEALDSQKAWELLEHKISPALEILNTDKAYIPIRFNKSYQKFVLFYTEFINQVKNNLPASTLDVLINCDKIISQINSLKLTKETKAMVSKDQVIYMTPYGTNDSDSTLELSKILKFLPLIHVVASSTKSNSLFAPEEIKTHCVCLEDYFSTNEWKQMYEDFDKSHPNTTWYDLTIPDDSNLVLGACRDLDNSF